MSYIDEIKEKYVQPGSMDVDEWKARLLEPACAEVDRLRAEVALATDTVVKCNAWVAEAKLLLELGGKSTRLLQTLTDQANAYVGNRV